MKLLLYIEDQWDQLKNWQQNPWILTEIRIGISNRPSISFMSQTWCDIADSVVSISVSDSVFFAM